MNFETWKLTQLFYAQLLYINSIIFMWVSDSLNLVWLTNLQLTRTYNWSFNFEMWTWTFSTIHSTSFWLESSQPSKHWWPSTVLDRLRHRFTNVPWQFSIVCDPFKTRSGHETVRNCQKRWAIRNIRKFILYKIKRFMNVFERFLAF